MAVGPYFFFRWIIVSVTPCSILWFAVMVLLFLFLPTSAFTLFWAGIILLVILTIFQIRKRKTMTTLQTALP